MIVDNFAGGGGASCGIEAAVGRRIDVAINHDPEAIAMHKANHPETKHYVQNIREVDPREVCQGREVELAWFSPDCKHFSKAKGGRPASKNIRDLAWVVVRWASLVRPRVIMLENVEEFQDWGPLDRHGRPCPRRRHRTFLQWASHLESLGYVVDWRELRACDYGTPTIRKRLFVIARCDGRPIVWPDATHGDGTGRRYRTAAEIIDWSQPVKSIFGRKRPLADATLRRIARGIERFVIQSNDPFIVPITHRGDDRVYDINEPLRTVTCANRGEKSLVIPYVVPRYNERQGQAPRVRSIEAPLSTVVPTGNHGSLCAAFLAQHNTGVVGHIVPKPLSTITGRGTQQQIVTSNIVKLRGTCRHGQPVTEPLATITGGGQHLAEVRAFLLKYYGTATAQDIRDPLHSITSKARFGLVTVHGTPYQIVDIGMRMLTPRELYAAQGFADDYNIDPDPCGELIEKRLTKTAQIRMAGNSVCQQVAAQLVFANVPSAQARQAAA